MNSPDRVLVFGDDMRVFLAVVRSLGRAGKEVHAAPFDWRAPALKSKYIFAVHHFPRYSEDSGAWLAAVSVVLQANTFRLVVPCCDPAILQLHAHREALAQFPIAIPNAASMELLFDKERTRGLCDELGISIVRGSRLRPGDSAPQLIERYGLPLVIKAARSYAIGRLEAAGRVWIVESQPELREVLGALSHSDGYLVEAFFEGAGVGVSVLAEKGNILHAFQHRRLREGRGGSSSYRVSERLDPELLGACEKLCAYTKLTGVCMFEFRRNIGNSRWVLLETNARFWGSLPLPISLGVDFPRFLFDLMVHGERHAPVNYQIGIRSRNFVLDGFNLLKGVRRLRANDLASWSADLGDFCLQPVRWLTGRERSDSLVRDDLWPAIWELGTILRMSGPERSWVPKKDQPRRPQTA